MVNYLTTNNPFYKGGSLIITHFNGSYDITIHCRENSIPRISISGYEKYLPFINQYQTPNSEEWELKIRTRSYQSLSVKEFEEMMKGYQAALETVKEVMELISGTKDLYQIKIVEDGWGEEYYVGLINGTVVTETYDYLEDLIEADNRFIGITVEL